MPPLKRWQTMPVPPPTLPSATGPIIFNKQYHALTEQMNNFGDALVKFVATESAIPLLSEDWVSIELFVQETSQRQNFNYLTIVDHKGVIRGSNSSAMIGKDFSGPAGKPSDGKISIAHVFKTVINSEKTAIVDYRAPILFQSKEIGQVHLGISQASLQQLAELTLYMMAGLLAVTIFVVVVFSYILGKYFSQSIYVVKKSMEQIIEGRYHQRIEKHQNDEFGQLYDTFNLMSETLQRNKIQQAKVRTGSLQQRAPQAQPTRAEDASSRTSTKVILSGSREPNDNLQIY